MAGTFIEVKADATQARKLLGELASRTKHLRPVLLNMGEHLLRSTKDRFDAQVDPAGRPWKPVRPDTMARKRTKKILIERSYLRDLIRYQVQDNVLVVGTDRPYGAIHQFGGKTPPRTIRATRKKALAWPGAAHPVKAVKHPGSNVPARPFLGLSEDDRRALADIIRDHLARLG